MTQESLSRDSKPALLQPVHFLEMLEWIGQTWDQWLWTVVKISLVFSQAEGVKECVTRWGRDASPYWVLLVRFLPAAKRRVAVGKEVS